jgi:hypothetical protein
MGLKDRIRKSIKKNVKKSETKPVAFKKKDKFVPIKLETYDYDREYIDMIKLALSENEECKIENGPKYHLDLDRNLVTLPLRWYTSAQRKSATLHASAHMTITPKGSELNKEEKQSYFRTRQIADLVEDIRVNRYLCYKYPGLLRYIKEDKQEIMKDLSIGDFDEECKVEEEKYTEGGMLGGILYEMKDEVRHCETYSEVLKVAEKINKELEEESKKRKCKCPTPSQAVSELLKLSEDSSPKERVQKTVNFGERSGIRQPLNDWHESEGSNQCKVVEKPAEYFLADYADDVETYPLNKGIVRLLQKNIPLRRKTRDGRLNKIDPVRMITDQKIFTRNTHQKKPPHFYFILDCSGSMGAEKLKWLKTITQTIINLIKSADMKYTLIAHSGSGNEFHYAEIKERQLKYLTAKRYNLDGSMLQTLFSKFINDNENNIVFYLSDGGLPAEFPEYEAPLIVKNIAKAQSMKIPILGIGIGTQQVKVFNDWYVINGPESLNGAIKKMSNKIITSIG